MIQKIFIGFLLSLHTISFSQQVGDTTYYNVNWKVITSKDSASYYGVVHKFQNGLFFLTDYYISGAVQMTGTYITLSPEKNRQGEFLFYYETGGLKRKIFFENDKKEGQVIEYFESGEIREEIDYTIGKRNGFHKTYYASGVLKRKDQYVNGEWGSGICYDENGKEAPYYPYDEDAEFPGGLQAMYQFIRDYTVYPPELQEKELEARVKVRFVVDESGSVTSVVAINAKDCHPLFVKSALATIRKMPKWSAAKQDGIPVKVYFTIPIEFKLVS
jgi:protein TonB